MAVFRKLAPLVALGLLVWWLVPPVVLFGVALVAFLVWAFNEGGPQ